MKQENITLLKAWATATNNLEKFVYLREDEKGRYIEYAFKEGNPHDNRCLSWYDKLQPNALVRNGHEVDKWEIHPTDQIYRLHAMDCGNQNEEGDYHCSPGHPCTYCRDATARHWTYDEPVKCACWLLEIVNDSYISKLKLDLDEAVKFSEIYRS
jgi:hypothetical protein